MEFTIYDALTNGSVLGGPVTNSAVNVTNGLFTTTVDFGNVFTGGSNWLAIAVSTNGANAFSPLSPRQQLTPVPYAIIAGNVSGTISATQLPDGLGGYNNTATNAEATVGGGAGNTAGGGASTVGGGQVNTATNTFATVSGGVGNTAGGTASTVGGGIGNKAANSYATVPGGADNVAGGQCSFAAGQQAQALNTGSFVWADDSSGSPFASTANNQFLIRATGGVGIGTTTPTSTLQVNGTVAATSLRAPGAGINTGTYAFIQMAVSTNTFADSTYIHNPVCNNDPNAILVITHNWTADTNSVSKYNTTPVGVWYSSNTGNWAIYNEDQSGMALGRAFNVLVIKP